jgi:hypothetical protein
MRMKVGLREKKHVPVAKHFSKENPPLALRASVLRRLTLLEVKHVTNRLPPSKAERRTMLADAAILIAELC